MNPFQQYAAQRADDLTAADEALRPAVRASLVKYGPPGWYNPILNEAEALFGMIYDDEGGDPDTLEANLTVFVDDLAEALAKTTTPTSPVDNAQVERVTTWVATYTANAATAATLEPDEKVVWTSMRDGDVRATHRAADGQVRTVGTTFDVGGAALRFPGDPDGPLEEVLGCRCLLLREGGETMARQFAITEETDPVPAVEDMPDGEPPQFTEETPQWHGVLAPEATASGDGRTFAANSITARDLPLPLRWVRSDMGAHDGAVVVGNITSIWRHDGLIKAQGNFRTDAPEADEVIGMIATDMLRGVSVDLDNVEFEVDDPGPDQDLILGEMPVTLTEGRVSAATLVDIPAFAEAMIALGPWPDGETEGWSLVAACLPCERQAQVDALNEAAKNPFPPKGEDSDPDGSVSAPEIKPGDRCTWGDGMVGTVESVDGDIATVVADDTGVPEQVPVADLTPVPEGDDDTEDSYRDVPPEERKGLADEGKAMPDGSFPIANCDDLHNAIQAIGRAKDPDAVKSHIKRRAADLNCGDDVIPEDWAAATETFAPGTKDGPGWLTNPRDTQRLRTYWTKGAGAKKIAWGTPGDFDRCRTNLAEHVNPMFLAGTCANLHKEALGVWPGQEARLVAAEVPEFMVASAAARTLPAAAFRNPNLTGPTAITVTADGRIFGHLATWDSCHIGVDKVCSSAPTSKADYAYFATGAVLTDEGMIPVGQITMDTGHAGLDANATRTTAHYDHTGTAAADVACGEDDHGVWVAGLIRDDLTENQVRALRGAALSGDWRRIRGNLELVAALAVNVPGFPIPRTAMAASAGVQTALVATGILSPPDAEPTIADLVRAALADIEAERTRTESISQARARLRAVRLADARAALKGN